MGSSYSDLWLQAIKEVLAEDGKPPLSAAEENQVRTDVDQMTAGRNTHEPAAMRSDLFNN
jgi:hypothetical protein